MLLIRHVIARVIKLIRKTNSYLVTCHAGFCFCCFTMRSSLDSIVENNILQCCVKWENDLKLALNRLVQQFSVHVHMYVYVSAQACERICFLFYLAIQQADRWFSLVKSVKLKKWIFFTRSSRHKRSHR